MFRYIKKKIIFSQIREMNSFQQKQDDKKYNTPILSDLKKNLDVLKNILSSSSDAVIREFNFGGNSQAQGALIYFNGMVNKDAVNNSILKPLMYSTFIETNNISVDLLNLDIIIKNVLTISEVEKVTLFADLLNDLLSGSTILLINGSSEALIINAKEMKRRGVKEPLTEGLVRGSREGFAESLQTNTTLLRSIIKDPDLCLETLKIGDKTRTEVCIAYLKDIVNQELINEVRTRLQRIHIDAVLESGYIEQFIEDAPFSIFSTVANSERPDKVASKILEGRAAIFIDGTPFVLTVPMLFAESFQSPEDYYSRTFFSGIIRLVRFLSYIISILAPAVYVALTIFHQELIPTQLLISIVAGHESVPFPAVLEAFLMIVTFEILREAGVRLPRPVGSAVSIVGALVIGQSAVSAGLISPLMVIVVAITAITSFVVPSQTDSIAILRYILLILAGFAGGFGILMGMIVTFIHLASLRSFGIPYLWPVAPLSISGLKDVFIRMPVWTMTSRPKPMSINNYYRMSPNLMPSPEKSDSTENMKRG